jgi:hypothetical protein
LGAQIAALMGTTAQSEAETLGLVLDKSKYLQCKLRHIQNHEFVHTISCWLLPAGYQYNPCSTSSLKKHARFLESLVVALSKN